MGVAKSAVTLEFNVRNLINLLCSLQGVVQVVQSFIRCRLRYKLNSISEHRSDEGVVHHCCLDVECIVHIVLQPHNNLVIVKGTGSWNEKNVRATCLRCH